MFDSIRPPAIEIRHTGSARGLGVFALRAFEPRQLVETCPAIVFEAAEFRALPEALRQRVYNWSALLSVSAGQQAVALGYGSIYNHANPANLRYYAVRTRRQICFEATRSIAIGDELTINYDEPRGVDASPASAWMIRNGLKPL